MKTITKSPQWRYKINIKDKLSDETTPELIIELCNHIIPQLENLRDMIEKDNLVNQDEKDHFDNKLFDVIDQFEFLRSLADGTIDEKDWHNYSFDGDFEEWFNDRLNELYDVADERILLKTDVSEKFLWID